VRKNRLLSPALSAQHFQQIFWAGVVAKCLTDVYEQIFVSWRKHKAAAELQWVLAQTMLFMAGGLCAPAGLHVVTTKKVEQGSMLEANGFVCFPLIVDQQRKRDVVFLAEKAGVIGIAQANRCDARSLLLECRFKFAQLRDMLTAENSPVMAKEDQYRRSAFPQRSQPRCLAFRVG
jgi:hypothetical protein